MQIGSSLDTLWQDMRFGGRTLVRSPGFATVAILTLALGIGANAAIFSVVNAVLLRPLPWNEPQRAVMIWSRWTAFDKTWVAEGEVNAYRRRGRAFEQVAAWGDGPVNITGDGEPERVTAGQVSANLFSTLGVVPLLGRTFTPEEDVPNGPEVAVLGYGLWSRRYGSDPSLVGRSILIDGRATQVIGVMPRDFMLPTDFQNPEPTQLWTPLQIDPASTDYGNHGLYAAGRLKPAATLAQASKELHQIARAMTDEGLHPPQMQFDTVVLSLADEAVGAVRRAVLLLFGAVAFLLLIACANVANLLLARAEARQREIAVRSALGASRARLVGQLLTESLALTGISAVVGLALAFGGVKCLVWWNPVNIPRVSAAGLDARVLLFTTLVAVLTSMIFSLAPALRALRVNLTDSLKDGSQTTSSSGSRQRFRNTLVVVEMALAVILLVGAGLMLRSLWSLQRVDLGLDPSNVLTMRLSLPQTSYQKPEQVVAFYQRLLDRVRAVPGVRAAGAIRALPLASTIGDSGMVVEGYSPPPGTNAKADWEIASDGYLSAMGERLVRGRDIARADTASAQLVILINEEMARRYWDGRDALGGRLKLRGPQSPWVTVVGIVGDVKHNGIAGAVKEKYYVPYAQWPVSTGSAIRSMSLVVKAQSDPRALVSEIRQEIRSLDPNLPIANVRTMEDIVGSTLSAPRFTGLLLGVFAALALALSAIGIYGVLSYVVSRRTREIGIRLAVGAGRGQVLRMVLRSGLMLSLTGIAAGIVGAVFLTRIMTGLLHGVSAGDPVTFVAVAVGLSAVALVASLVPAWRATRVDPVIALKTE